MSTAGHDGAPQSDSAWPALRVDSWTDTRDTLHMWLQIMGKLRLAGAPMVNHWWQATFYATPRGLTTGSIRSRIRAFGGARDSRVVRRRRPRAGEWRLAAFQNTRLRPMSGKLAPFLAWTLSDWLWTVFRLNGRRTYA